MTMTNKTQDPNRAHESQASGWRSSDEVFNALSDIMTFAEHDDDCHINIYGGYRVPECTCGYTAASRKALRILESLLSPPPDKGDQ